MTPLETRIRDALRTSAELPVSQEDLEKAEARFRSRQELPSRRPRGARVFPAVALAVAAALAVGAGLVWWLVQPGTGGDIEPAAPAPRPTQSSATDDRVGFVGLPPPWAAPTGSSTGQLVVSAGGWDDPTWVFADGRLITLEREAVNEQGEGYLVRQLTRAGVEAMRSYILDRTTQLIPPEQTGAGPTVRDGGRLMVADFFDDCDQWDCPAIEEPETWLPATAWAEPTFRPFVPHAYEICLSGTASPADVLPAELAEILPADPNEADEYCQVVLTPQARALADVMDGAGPGYVRREDPGGLAYEVPQLGGSGSLMFTAVLPDGSRFCFLCG